MTELMEFHGTVLTQGDPGYDEARAVFNGLVDRKPQRVMRCTDAEDVAAALRWSVARGPARLGVRRWAQRHGRSRRRRWHVHRPARDRPRAGRPGGEGPPGRRGRSVGSGRRGDAGARAGRHRRARLHHGGGRAVAGERQRVARAQARVHLRQPAVRPGGDRGRRRRDGVAGGEPGPVLGAARRRRQLRRRHRVHLPAAPGRADRARRHAALPRLPGRRRAQALARLHAHRTGRGRQRRGAPHRPARGVRAGAGARPAGRRRADPLRRRPGGGRARLRPAARSSARRRRTSCGPMPYVAVQQLLDPPQPAGHAQLLERRLPRRAPRRGGRHLRRRTSSRPSRR